MTNPLLARFASTPILLPPDMRAKFDACMCALAGLPHFADMLNERVAADDGFWPSPDNWRYNYRPYIVDSSGILRIPVEGILLDDFSFATSWATGYTYIWRAFERGMNDPLVKGIALVCDSPGGEVACCFDVVDKMAALRDSKPVRAFAHETAYSAAYAIAAVAQKIIVSRTGGVGSIGVYTMHVDYSGMLEQAGIKPTYIDAPKGGHKVDGNPYQPLPDDVRARIQARMDELYEVFVSSVARNRGMKEQAVRDTQALCFTASQATSNGLADAVGSLDDAVAAFAADLSCNDDEGDEDMTTKTDNATATAEQPAALAAARAEGKAEGLAEGKAEGAKAERERISAILAHDAAKNRRELAVTIAVTTDLSVEQAAALLGKTPEEKAKGAQAGMFERAMAENNPEIGSESGRSVEVDEEKAATQRILETAYGKRPAKK